MTYPTKNPLVTGAGAGDGMPRDRLAAVSRGLQGVHESLLGAVQTSFERLYGRVPGPAALLRLVMEDPLFTWLRPLSALVVELDTLLDDRSARIDVATLDEVRNTIERRLGISGEPDEFAESYRVYLQTDPGVVMAHAALRQELKAIPRQ